MNRFWMKYLFFVLVLCLCPFPAFSEDLETAPRVEDFIGEVDDYRFFGVRSDGTESDQDER